MFHDYKQYNTKYAEFARDLRVHLPFGRDLKVHLLFAGDSRYIYHLPLANGLMAANQGLQNIRKFRFFGPIENARVKPKNARVKAKEST